MRAFFFDPDYAVREASVKSKDESHLILNYFVYEDNRGLKFFFIVFRFLRM